MMKTYVIYCVMVMLHLVYCTYNTRSKRNFIGSKNVLFIIADDAGFETQVYNNSVCKTPNLNALAKKSLIFKNSYTSVSSCSPSRSAVLTGLPTHQNGMYGLHHSIHHFNSFDKVQSLPLILSDNSIRTGIVGKKHVGPEAVYPFDYAETEENNPILQVGRNITRMKELVRKFLQSNDSRPFFLYIGFHDPHRCGGLHPQYGSFCEKFGNGEEGMGVIPDWKPQLYTADEIILPYFVQNTPAAREDIAKQYTTIGRYDQGIGIILNELSEAGYGENTLIIYTSDNGIPFPYGRTNVQEPGIKEPFMISSPLHNKRWGQESKAFTSHLDIVPTILEWYGIDYPQYTLNKQPVKLTGKSLLPVLQTEPYQGWDVVYTSHQLHEITMYYPMRTIRNQQYKLILNLNYRAPFPIDIDFAASPTFKDLLTRTENKQQLPWFSTLEKYYYRAPFEFYDLDNDPHEFNNLYNNTKYSNVMKKLFNQLQDWQKLTNDPWQCYPWGVLEYSGKCVSLDNSMPNIQFSHVDL